MDFIFVSLTLAFFGGTAAYAAWCNRLDGRRS
jgi:hypothetical protein